MLDAEPVPQPFHGALQLRGLEETISASAPPGRFGRMFGELPPFRPPDPLLVQLGHGMRETDRAQRLGLHPNDFDSTIPAGYTYLAQLIDHDLSFDPVSRLRHTSDAATLPDFRTPRLDLDSLYGGGPILSPYLYARDRVHLRIGKAADDTDDLPRIDPASGRPASAVIGDPRNDENVILSQLHLAFIKFHNRIVDWLYDKRGLQGLELLNEASRRVRWHYQWIVVHDFLPRLVPRQIVHDILREEAYLVPSGPPTAGDREGQVRTVRLPRVALRFFRWGDRAFIPVEFAGAAYRFAHSMVRPSYALSFRVAGSIPFAELRGLDQRGEDLEIYWPNFFDFKPAPPRAALQFARKIDTVIADPLSALSREMISDLAPNRRADDLSLPIRDLRRGWTLGLPSGQAVARAMALPRDLTLQGRDFSELDGNLTPFQDETPLWYYVLREAERFCKGEYLGPVGGRIVAEVLLGLLAADPTSYLRVDPSWTPASESANGGAPPTEGSERVFDMTSLLRLARAGLAGPEISGDGRGPALPAARGQ